MNWIGFMFWYKSNTNVWTVSRPISLCPNPIIRYLFMKNKIDIYLIILKSIFCGIFIIIYILTNFELVWIYIWIVIIFFFYIQMNWFLINIYIYIHTHTRMAFEEESVMHYTFSIFCATPHLTHTHTHTHTYIYI